MSNIRLLALDLDGTLFDPDSIITDDNKIAIKNAVKNDVNVVISTGRPFMGLPFDQIKGTGIKYAITTNGAAIYDIEEEKCIYENSMDADFIMPILDFLLTKDIHMDAFIKGRGYTQLSLVPTAEKLNAPAPLKHYIINTRKRVDDLRSFIKEENLRVQKMTLNFYPDGNGGFVDREDVRIFLENNPTIISCTGGYNNLEFTKKGVDKGLGLRELAKLLDIDIKDTMAIGDSGNDLAIINAAGIGVAMENATDDIKNAASFITKSNKESGVAYAINKLILQ